MSYTRTLQSISYRNNILELWYGGADHYVFINKDGLWYKQSSMRRVDDSKQLELDNLVASRTSTPRGRSKV